VFLHFVDWELKFGVFSLGRGIWEPKLVTLIILSGIIIVVLPSVWAMSIYLVLCFSSSLSIWDLWIGG